MRPSFMENPLFAQLGFTEEWFIAGILSDLIFATIIQEYSETEDNSFEHYRWKTFKDFLKNHPFISEKTFLKIYDLSLQESDYAMGRAMRFDLVKRKECPLDLIEKAIADPNTSLKRYALKQKNLKIVNQ